MIVQSLIRSGAGGLAQKNWRGGNKVEKCYSQSTSYFQIVYEPIIARKSSMDLVKMSTMAVKMPPSCEKVQYKLSNSANEKFSRQRKLILFQNIKVVLI